MLCAFLPSSSLLSSAADVNASAFGVQGSTNQYYFTTTDDVISERYVSSFQSDFNSLPFDVFVDNDYPDVSLQATVMMMDVTFTDEKKFYNTNYRLQFDIDQPYGASHHVYLYAFTVPSNYDISSSATEAGDYVVTRANLPIAVAVGNYGIGDVISPNRMYNSINSQLTSEFGNNILDTITMKDADVIFGDNFTCDIFIPDNQATVYESISATNGYGERKPLTLRMCLLFIRNSDVRVSNFTIKNFTLIPIKGTEQFYKDEIFQNDVIGSDEDGNESGLKGIIAFLKDLPGAIFEYFAAFFLWLIGSDQEGNESGILGILAYIKKLPSLIMDKLKELFVPDDEFLNDTLADMDAFMIQHLGILYQAPKELIELISDFISLDVPFFDDVGDYKLKMPALTIYVNSEPPPGQDIIYSNIDNDYQDAASDLSSYTAFNVLPDNSLSGEEEGFYLRLDFLTKQPFDILYNIYRVFSYAFVIVIFLLYAYRRFNAVLGGLGSS